MEQQRIIVLDGHAVNPGDLSWRPFTTLGDIEIYDRTLPSELFDHIGNAPVILTNKVPMTREIMEALPHLKYIGVLATGHNIIDNKAAHDLGITVTYIPEYATFATAQMTFALLLEITNRVAHHNQLVHDGVWNDCPDFSFTSGRLMELWGKKIGIIGYGQIGKCVAQIALAMGMTVLATSRSIEDSLMRKGSYHSLDLNYKSTQDITFASLEEIYRDSDIITCHCPLTSKTRGLINKQSIDKMKDGVILINNSRGMIFNEMDVAAALASGKISGAAVDVLSTEPPAFDNPMLTAPNCIITPHISWAAQETRQRLMNIAFENLESYLAGNPINVVK